MSHFRPSEVLKCREQHDLHLLRGGKEGNAKELHLITLPIRTLASNPPSPLSSKHLSRKAASPYAQEDGSNPSNTTSLAPLKVIPPKVASPCLELDTNKRSVTPCKEKQTTWKSSALSLILSHPTCVSMEAEDGAGSLWLQITVISLLLCLKRQMDH